MKRSNPNKMIPVESLGPAWTYVFNGRIKALGWKPATPEQRRTLKQFHKKKCRNYNKKVVNEE